MTVLTQKSSESKEFLWNSAIDFEDDASSAPHRGSTPLEFSDALRGVLDARLTSTGLQQETSTIDSFSVLKQVKKVERSFLHWKGCFRSSALHPFVARWYQPLNYLVPGYAKQMAACFLHLNDD